MREADAYYRHSSPKIVANSFRLSERFERQMEPSTRLDGISAGPIETITELANIDSIQLAS